MPHPTYPKAEILKADRPPAGGHAAGIELAGCTDNTKSAGRTGLREKLFG